MKITTIIPVYNRADLIARAVRSITDQQGDWDADILIVDDGSTDATPDVLAKLAATRPEVRLVTQANGGVSKARNAGLRHVPADADIVTFLDSDDVMAPGRFAADLPLLAADPSLGVTYGRMAVTDRFDDGGQGPHPDAAMVEIVAPHLTSGLYRRSALERIGPFDEAFTFSEDVDYLFRLFEAGTSFVQTDTLCFYYLRHSGNMTAARDPVDRSFALAILKSMQRRKQNPGLQTERPRFDLTALQGTTLF